MVSYGDCIYARAQISEVSWTIPVFRLCEMVVGHNRASFYTQAVFLFLRLTV